MQARHLLGAYRRDDWLPSELDALGEHLGGCAECRRVEAAYRETGEHIRQLPTITPPASFRAAVFAAIRAEEAKLGRSLEEAASDDTQPNLPALKPLPVRTWSPRGAIVGARAAIAVAAVLLLGVGVARVAPAIASGAPRLASFVAGALPFGPAAGPRIVQYQLAAVSGRLTSAMAGGHWLVYVATDAHNNSTIYARERGTSKTIAVPGAHTSGPVELRAVTDGWVIWQTGSELSSQPWTLWASPLSVGGRALSLADSHVASEPTGVWAQGNVVLATFATPADGGVLARFDLAAGRPAPAWVVIAHAQAPTHLLAAPSLAGDSYYWSEVWYDAAGLHSDIWSKNVSGAAQAITSGGTAFAPHASDVALVWVQGSAISPVTSATLDQSLEQKTGALHERGLSGGPDRQIAAHAQADTLQVAGPLVLWHDGAQTHTYDLTRNGPSAVDSAVRAAGYASANGTALTWGEVGSSTINIYDGR